MELQTAFYDYERNASHQESQMREVDSWFLMSTIWTPAAITSAYLYFVIFAGPKLMKGRAPFSLMPHMFVYNLLQVFFSTWLVIKGLKATFGVLHRAACMPTILNPQNTYEVDSLAWYYLMSKYVEFLDTVFFILRGKWSQVTFLHVYHHANMAFFTWVYVKYIPGIQIFMIALCNSFIHAVMYGYYLLASFGPGVQRFLWWKRYITMLQIVQFFTIIGHMFYLHLNGCNTPSGYVLFTICNTTSFLVLFLLFYARAYSKKKVQ